MSEREHLSRNALPSASPHLAVFHFVAAMSVAACGGGVPLLHPARALDQGQVRAAAGFSANIAVGEFAKALGDARAETMPNANPSVPVGPDETYAKGALVLASIAPGLAPLVAARVGLGNGFEGGLAYTGRAARLDARRSVDLTRRWALSLGAGGTAALYGRQGSEALPGVDLGQLHGWGADVPVLVGYASDSDLYTVWLGARGGWEQVDITNVRSVPTPVALGAQPASLSATRLWGSGIVGLAVGFRHVHVSMEIDVCYASVAGDYAGTHARLGGFTVAPASALWWRF